MQKIKNNDDTEELREKFNHLKILVLLKILMMSSVIDNMICQISDYYFSILDENAYIILIQIRLTNKHC